MGGQCEQGEQHIKQGVSGLKSKVLAQLDRQRRCKAIPKLDAEEAETIVARYLPTLPRLGDLTVVHCQSRCLVSSFSPACPICAPSRLGGTLSRASSTPSMGHPLYVLSDLDGFPGCSLRVLCFSCSPPVCLCLALASIWLLSFFALSTLHYHSLPSYVVSCLHL